MKKTISLFLLLFLSLAIVSCGDDDDDLKLTRENGKPSLIETGDGTKIYFYYSGDKLSKIKEKKGSVITYGYANDALVSLSYAPEDKNVADGHAFTRFQQLDISMIRVESSGEPGFQVFKWDITVLGGLPVRITELGFYSPNPHDAEEPISEGRYYADFEYDPTNFELKTLTVYDKETNEKVATHTYLYDGKPGVLSKINLPLWYYAYRAYLGKTSWGTYGYEKFFHSGGNLLKETMELADRTETVNWTYQYNEAGYPIVSAHDHSDQNQVKITY